MKKAFNRIGLAFVALVLSCLLGFQSTAHAQGGDVSFQTFYDELSPYGQWIEDPDYGFVWIPDVQDDFRPYYSNGRWAMTQYGNTWVSNYDWGWAPFHYGRWSFHPMGRWIWIPGYEWAPAWVSWRQGGGYYGWAPLGPGISININVGYANRIPMDWWVFTPYNYIYGNWQRNAYWGPRYNNIYSKTVIINNNYYYGNRYYVAAGPRRNDIQRYTKQRVTVYNIQDARSPSRNYVRGNSLSVYRPSVNASTVRSARPARVASQFDNNNKIGRELRSIESSRGDSRNTNVRTSDKPDMRANTVERNNTNRSTGNANSVRNQNTTNRNAHVENNRSNNEQKSVERSNVRGNATKASSSNLRSNTPSQRAQQQKETPRNTNVNQQRAQPSNANERPSMQRTNNEQRQRSNVTPVQRNTQSNKASMRTSAPVQNSRPSMQSSAPAQNNRPSMRSSAPAQRSVERGTSSSPSRGQNGGARGERGGR